MGRFKKEYAIWTLTKQRGKWRYIVWDWGVLWGTPMVMRAFNSRLQGRTHL